MRMSASSSTIRMSCAMRDFAQIGRLFWIGAPGGAGLRHEDQAHPSADRLGIFQKQLALVIFHDLLDDGEPQAGTLGSRRDVGLGQSLAAALRQAFAIVL